MLWPTYNLFSVGFIVVDFCGLKSPENHWSTWSYWYNWQDVSSVGHNIIDF